MPANQKWKQTVPEKIIYKSWKHNVFAFIIENNASGHWQEIKLFGSVLVIKGHWTLSTMSQGDKGKHDSCVKYNSVKISQDPLLLTPHLKKFNVLWKRGKKIICFMFFWQGFYKCII